MGVAPDLRGKLILAPASSLLVDGVVLPDRLIGYKATESVVAAGAESEFTLADPRAALDLAEGMQVQLRLGYQGLYAPTPVYTGRVLSVARRQDTRVRTTTDFALAAEIKVTWRRMTPESIVRGLLAACAFPVDVARLDLPPRVLPHFVCKQASVKEHLRSLRYNLIRHKWPIGGHVLEEGYPTWWFDRLGQFHWHGAEAGISGAPFRFEYGFNISELNPADSAPGLIRLTTYPVPWVQAGDMVLVTHPYVGEAQPFRVDTHVHERQGGRTRSDLMLSPWLTA